MTEQPYTIADLINIRMALTQFQEKDKALGLPRSDPVHDSIAKLDHHIATQINSFKDKPIQELQS